ncbi:hypothetical protein SDC9_114787 [bioreactor metagenome]|uniref:Uncharacterized protein n=1 Tax=bioreactor metagenome TaxID=1076179 RepID=A0A645BRM4_9ZZZZ
MGDVAVVKTADNLGNRVNLADMGQKFITKPLALGSSFNQTGNINKPHRSRNGFLGLIHFSQFPNPFIRHFNNPDIRLNGAKRIVCGLCPCLGNGIKQCTFADIGKSYNADL